MTRGSLRFSEEMYKAHMAKSGFKSGTAASAANMESGSGSPMQAPPSSAAGVAPGPLTPQRLAAPVPPASTPPRVSGVGEAPITRPGTFITKPSKYKNKPTNGYASIKESKRAFQLKLMQEAGQIRNLREQVSYLLIPKQDGERACSYIADFVYEEWRPIVWHPIVEDCKGMRTDIYRLKRKLLLFVHGIRIRET